MNNTSCPNARGWKHTSCRAVLQNFAASSLKKSMKSGKHHTLVIWMPFCKDALQVPLSNLQPCKQPVELQLPVGTQLGLLHISMVWVHALGCKCIFGASTSPYLAVWAGWRQGHMTGKALAWSLFYVLTPRTPPCTTHLVVCTRDHRSRAEHWHVEISKSYYIVSMDADCSRTWTLHEGTRVQERNSNFCTQAHYFEKQC